MHARQTKPLAARRRLRVCYVEANPFTDVGGSYFSLYYLVKHLDRSRFEPLAVFYRRHKLIPTFEAVGCRVLVFEPTAPVGWGGRGERRGLRRLALQLPVIAARRAVNATLTEAIRISRLIALLRREAVGLVHLNSSVILNHDWMVACKLAGVPCMTHERSPRDLRFRSFDRFAYHQLVRAVICISGEIAGNLRGQGLGGQKLFRIYNGLDPAEVKVLHRRDVVCRELSLPTSSRLLVLAGNLRAWKGQDVAVQAMPLILAEQPEACLLLAGEATPRDTDFLRRLETLIRELGLTGRVQLVGFRRDVHDLMAAADLVLHTSVEPEPFGRVILEAMALSKAVVAPLLGGPSEILEDGISGLLVPPRDPQALARAVLLLLADGEMRRQLGENAYQRLITHFSIDRNVRETMAVYDDILAGRL